jgi:hypothetical protein
MKLSLTNRALAGVVSQLLTNVRSGHLDDAGQFTDFVAAIAGVVAQYCGGEVDTVTRTDGVSFEDSYVFNVGFEEIPGGEEDPGVSAWRLKEPAPSCAEVLELVKSSGLTIHDYLSVISAPSDDPYLVAARRKCEKIADIAIDEKTVTSVHSAGAWVLSWLFVSREEASKLPVSVILEDAATSATKALVRKKPTTAVDLREKVTWLTELVMNFPDELDAMNLDVDASDGNRHEILWPTIKPFRASMAIAEILDYAKDGMTPEAYIQGKQLVDKGSILDSAIKVHTFRVA